MSGVTGEFTGNHDEEGKRLEAEQIKAEAQAFLEQINNLVGKDEGLLKLSYVPIKDPEHFFEVCKDGIVLCKVINAIKPGTIKEKEIKMNVNKDNINVPGSKDAWEIATMINTSLDAAKKMGCVIVNIGSNDILGGSKHLILAVIWQVIRAHLMKSVNLASHPELIRLLKPGEKIDKLLNMRAEDIIKRWFNYHLKRAGPDETGNIKVVNNFGKDVSDCSKWVTLLKQIAPNESEEADIDEVMEATDLHERATRLLDVAEELDCRDFTTPTYIVKGYERLNLAFTATIFNNHIGITLPTEAEIERLYAELDDLKKRCIDCNEALALLQKQVADLEAEKTRLNEELEASDRKVKVIEGDVVKKTEEINSMLAIKNAEIEKLKKLLAEKEAELLAKLKELEELMASYSTVEEEINTEMGVNKDTIASLEGQITDLEEACQNLQDLADGKGNNVDQMKEQLEKKKLEVEDKSAIINNHLKNGDELMKSHANELEVELPNVESSDDKDRLNGLIEANGVLVKQYEGSLTEKRKTFKRHEDEEKKELDELNREVASFLGEGQSSAEDAIANMKRLLELMIEKCRKQAAHIETQQVTIEKKNQMNTLVGSKICDLAAQQSSKKKPVFGKKKK